MMTTFIVPRYPCNRLNAIALVLGTAIQFQLSNMTSPNCAKIKVLHLRTCRSRPLRLPIPSLRLLDLASECQS